MALTSISWRITFTTPAPIQPSFPSPHLPTAVKVTSSQLRHVVTVSLRPPLYLCQNDYPHIMVIFPPSSFEQAVMVAAMASHALIVLVLGPVSS
ncbi:hypothetical protein SESBI_40232 [Sesbania bispinosa]|nr:hypothetical protein SESBI_40232 [Sesbania bispinosa]